MQMVTGAGRIEALREVTARAIDEVTICVRDLDVAEVVADLFREGVARGLKATIIFTARSLKDPDNAWFKAFERTRFLQAYSSVTDAVFCEEWGYAGALNQGEFGSDGKLKAAILFQQSAEMVELRTYRKYLEETAKPRDMSAPMFSSSALGKQLGLKTPVVLKKLESAGYLTAIDGEIVLTEKAEAAGAEIVTTGPWSPYILWPAAVAGDIER